MEQRSFQELIEENFCWGCGVNEPGFHIRSHWSGDESVCTWQPKEYHMAGPRHILNGGIIATIIDCHCICTAVAAAYKEEGREINTRPDIWYATASLQISYLKPALIKEPVVLRAKVKEMKGKKTILTCSLFSRGEECARAEVVAVRVPDAWRKENTQQ